MEINVTAVRLAMADAGYSTSELARRAKITRQTASKYVCKGGKGTPEVFHKIGEALGVKPSSLVLVR